MSLDHEILERVRAAAVDATRWHEISTVLSGAAEDDPDMRLRPFVYAFAYNLIDGLSERRQAIGEPYGSMFSSENERFPPRIADVQAEDVAAWREALDAIDLPAVQARLGDLLWIRRASPRPDVAARSAVTNLLILAKAAEWSPIERTRMLARALDITRELRDTDLQETVVAAIHSHVKTDLESQDGGPGVSLGVLRPLVGLPAAERPEFLDALLVLVGERYGTDVYIAATVFELRGALTDSRGREALVRSSIARWRDEATRGDAILRVDRLERALELARTNGIADVADELRAELARIAPEDLDLTSISVDIQLPEAEVDAFLASYTEAASWEVAFEILAVQPVPGGSQEAMGILVDELMEQFPIQFLFPKAVIGPDNATAIFRAATPEAHRKLAMAEQRSRATRVWSIVCARVLDRIGERPDRPDREAMTTFFSATGIAAPETAERVARAVELYWSGEPDESAHIILPRIETMVREMARLVGVPIIHEPRPGQEIGGVAMLGGLLHDLRAAFAEKTLIEYLIDLMTNQLGLNLRNRILHGLHGPVDRFDAALLIQVAVVLSRMQPTPIESNHGSIPPAQPNNSTPTSGSVQVEEPNAHKRAPRPEQRD